MAPPSQSLLPRPKNGSARDRGDHLAATVAALQELLVASLPPSTALELAPDRALSRINVAREYDDHSDSGVALTREILAAELLAAVRLELASDVGAGRTLVARMEQELGVHRALLARELLRGPDLLSLPPMMAVSSQLVLLMILAPLEEVSLWSREPAGDLRCISHEGEAEDTTEATKFARSLLRRGATRTRLGPLVGQPVLRWTQPVAAIVGRGDPACFRQTRAMLAEAADMLAVVLERDELLTQRAEIEQTLSDTRERQLTRLGLDLHDGPLQDVAALARDIRLFRQQLARTLSGHQRAPLLLGRVDDLDAQLVAVDADLRRLAVSLQSPFLTHHDFVRAVHETCDAFTALAAFPPKVTLAGDLTLVSASQQMALLAILREALNNVREHTDASAVSIGVSADAAGVHAEFTDNGGGFDVEQTLMRAAKDGHVGLVGMQERVRLLNGHSHIESRPGGPTAITVSMPLWQPAK